MPKPVVKTSCPANRFTGPDERIIEFCFPDLPGAPGGLISFRRMHDGTPRVEVYRCHESIRVIAPEAEIARQAAIDAGALEVDDDGERFCDECGESFNLDDADATEDDGPDLDAICGKCFRAREQRNAR